MKTLSKFVLIDNQKRKEIPLQWETSTFSKTLAPQSTTNLTYRDKKNLISNLNPKLNSSKNFSLRRISTKRRLPTSESTKKITPFIYSNTERQNGGKSAQITMTSKDNHFNVRLQTRQAVLPKEDVQIVEIKNKIVQSYKKKGKIISIITMRRFGLRYRLKYEFFTINRKMNHAEFIKKVKQKIFPQFASTESKMLYLFHLGKQPINNIHTDINEKQYIIFGDLTPKFNLPFEVQMKLFEQATHLEGCILEELQKFQEIKDSFSNDSDKNDESKDKYEWQRIKDVKKHVESIIENPQLVKDFGDFEQRDEVMENWLAEKYTQEKINSKIKNEKHPFFDLQSHFPKETNEKQALTQAAHKIEKLSYTNNRHKFKKQEIDNMMQKIKRQQEEAQNAKKEEEKKERLIGYKSEKEFFRQLNEKNLPLSQQNIPYIMEKYEITRAQAYNLYNIYKSLQKISAMRLFKQNQFRNVKLKGIDRKTFDQGLKGLQINPGQQVIRNICYFHEFISWEEFIKIISISLRKTPESKLKAILEGIGSVKGMLTKNQVGIMVGSSLMKIFGTDEPELRQYFVNMVMKQLDKDESGTIDKEQLMAYVFESSSGEKDMDMISYLMLNS